MYYVYVDTFRYKNPALRNYHIWVGLMIEFKTVTHLCFLNMSLHLNETLLQGNPTLGLIIEFKM